MKREEAISVLYMVEAHGLADEAKRMAIEALCREQKEEDLAKDIARQMATIIENEQDMRVILKSTEPTDLISRADAIEAVAQQWLFEASAESPYVNDDDIGDYRKLASELLSDIPSADRPSGEWVIRENGNKECSLCGHERQYGWDYFCGYCGAKMGSDAR